MMHQATKHYATVFNINIKIPFLLPAVVVAVVLVVNQDKKTFNQLQSQILTGVPSPQPSPQGKYSEIKSICKEMRASLNKILSVASYKPALLTVSCVVSRIHIAVSIRTRSVKIQEKKHLDLRK